MDRSPGDVSEAASPQLRALRVMTFNILHDSVRNLTAPWSRRRPFVTETIRSARPDIACLQEVSHRQLEDLALDLAEYEFFQGAESGATTLPHLVSGLGGIARSIFGDFFERGELCPILLLKGHVACVQRGTFWLSPRYEGSKPPRGLLPTPHVANWVRVEVRPGLLCAVYNTHLGLLPWTGRRTANQLLAALDRDWNAEPQILAGDFNSPPSGTLLRTLAASRGTDLPALNDAWLEAGQRVGSGRTFHWGFGLPGPRLDYILVRPRCSVLRASTVGGRMGRTFPSDHFALAAELQIVLPCAPEVGK
jgi:endonuclease/exonuclease/phosphatase family metal-dependent hydrolase